MNLSAVAKSDLYTSVTNQIVEAIEAGASTFNLPWHTIPGLPRNITSSQAYRGINTLLLWLTANTKGYASPIWGTFKQWRELGHPVRKGEKSATVVFWKQLCGQDDADGEAVTDKRFVARAYHVFNARQVEGYVLPDVPVLPEADRDGNAEAFFNRLPLTVRHDDDHAYYRLDKDSIHLPPFSCFRDANAYYATRGHESVHATGAEFRLNRSLVSRFGSDAYAVEELVAELGAAFICARLGLSAEPRPDHAGYLASWLKVLKADNRAIFTAAGNALAAVDWLFSHP